MCIILICRNEPKYRPSCLYPPHGTSLMLNFLEFSNDIVHNVIIDNIHPEMTLVTTDQIAQSLFRNRNTVPINDKNEYAKSAITFEFNR